LKMIRSSQGKGILDKRKSIHKFNGRFGEQYVIKITLLY
jgi:hypothetical protein